MSKRNNSKDVLSNALDSQIQISKKISSIETVFEEASLSFFKPFLINAKVINSEQKVSRTSQKQYQNLLVADQSGSFVLMNCSFPELAVGQSYLMEISIKKQKHNRSVCFLSKVAPSEVEILGAQLGLDLPIFEKRSSNKPIVYKQQQFKLLSVKNAPSFNLFEANTALSLEPLTDPEDFEKPKIEVDLKKTLILTIQDLQGQKYNFWLWPDENQVGFLASKMNQEFLTPQNFGQRFKIIIKDFSLKTYYNNQSDECFGTIIRTPFIKFEFSDI